MRSVEVHLVEMENTEISEAFLRGWDRCVCVGGWGMSSALTMLNLRSQCAIRWGKPDTV